MLIISSLFYFSMIFAVGYLIVQAGWKLRYLIPLCFFSSFTLVFSIFWLFARDGRHIELFVDGKFLPNAYTISALQASGGISGLLTFLLIVTVLAAWYES